MRGDGLGSLFDPRHEQYSDKYMAFGIRNAIEEHLGKLIDRLEHDAPEALEETRLRLKRMVDDGHAAFFLKSISVRRR